jgi:hypothetical protein
MMIVMLGGTTAKAPSHILQESWGTLESKLAFVAVHTYNPAHRK